MKEDDLNYAKQIFLKYTGSYFHMIRDERYREYKKYKVSKETENKWIKEYQLEMIRKFISTSNNTKLRYIFYNLCDTLKNYNNIDSLKKLIKLIKIIRIKIEKKEIDSFNQLIISEQLLKIVEQYYEDDMENEVIIETKEFAIKNLCKLISSPLKYTEEIDEEDIILRAKECIKKWK